MFMFNLSWALVTGWGIKFFIICRTNRLSNNNSNKIFTKMLNIINIRYVICNVNTKLTTNKMFKLIRICPVERLYNTKHLLCDGGVINCSDPRFFVTFRTFLLTSPFPFHPPNIPQNNDLLFAQRNKQLFQNDVSMWVELASPVVWIHM